MKHNALLMLLFLIWYNCMAQETKKDSVSKACNSSIDEMIKYLERYESSEIKRTEYKRFKSVSKQHAKSLQYDHIHVRKDKSKNNPYSDYWDCFDTLTRDFKTISAIHKHKEYIVYRDDFYDDYWLGIWLEIKDGDTSRKYYLGFTENYYYHIKGAQNIPLFKNDSIIQLQAAVVRESKQRVLPVREPQFELVKDHYTLEIDINKVFKDSDFDGLTDIVEEKLMLDKNNSDTDHDGIPDNIDPNPRFKSWDNDTCKLYSFLLYGSVNDSIIFDPQKPTEKDSCAFYGKPQLIVTDIPYIMHIDPLRVNRHVIIMSPSEYKQHKNKYPMLFKKRSVSKMYKIDKIPNAFRINISESNYDVSYAVFPFRNGKWAIKQIISLII